MRMAVLARWLTMCSPSGMSNAGMRVKDFGQVWLLLLDKLFQLGNFANLLEGKHFVLLVSVDGKACRILYNRQRADDDIRA